MAFSIFFSSCLCPYLLAQVCKSFICSLVQNLLKLITIVFTHRMNFPNHLHHFNPQTTHALSRSGGGMLWDERLPQLRRAERKRVPSWSLEVGKAAVRAAGVGTPTRHRGSSTPSCSPGFGHVRSLAAACHASLFTASQQVVSMNILSHRHSLVITVESLFWGEKGATLLTNVCLSL